MKKVFIIICVFLMTSAGFAEIKEGTFSTYVKRSKDNSFSSEIKFRYKLTSLMGEPVVNIWASFEPKGDIAVDGKNYQIDSFPSRVVNLLRMPELKIFVPFVTGGNGMYSMFADAGVMSAPGKWSFNVAGSPKWSEWLKITKEHISYIPEKEAKEAYKNFTKLGWGINDDGVRIDKISYDVSAAIEYLVEKSKYNELESITKNDLPSETELDKKAKELEEKAEKLSGDNYLKIEKRLNEQLDAAQTQEERDKIQKMLYGLSQASEKISKMQDDIKQSRKEIKDNEALRKSINDKYKSLLLTAHDKRVEADRYIQERIQSLQKGAKKFDPYAELKRVEEGDQYAFYAGETFYFSVPKNKYYNVMEACAGGFCGYCIAMSQCGYLNYSGDVVVPPNYPSSTRFGGKGLVVAGIKALDREDVYDLSGKIIRTGPKFSFGITKEGYISVRTYVNGLARYHYYDIDGNERYPE